MKQHNGDFWGKRVNLSLPEINPDFSGFEALVRLALETEDCSFDTINIDMSKVTWFNADMCAVFGAILYRLGRRINTIHLVQIPTSVKNILSKNGFLSHYGQEKIPDLWGTTVPYRRFDAKDDRYFFDYIENELIHRSEIPSMSSGLLKKFRESIFEIFSNAVLHSRTEMGIFSCGQIFPIQQRLNFVVTDLGVGMCRNIQENMGLDLSPEAAIAWATQGRNTTKRDGVPGGMGLKLLGEFIDLNGGCIQIVSDAGYWCRKDRMTSTRRLPHAFPGTAVHVGINTADTHSYRLASEQKMSDVF